MKTITKLIKISMNRSPLSALALALVALAVGTLTANATPGDLFESDTWSNTIYEFTLDGTRSTFASGLNVPLGLAFDSAGNLFEGDLYSATIYKFAPDGTRSTFATGLNRAAFLAIQPTPAISYAAQIQQPITRTAPVHSGEWPLPESRAIELNHLYLRDCWQTEAAVLCLPISDLGSLASPTTGLCGLNY